MPRPALETPEVPRTYRDPSGENAATWHSPNALFFLPPAPSFRVTLNSQAGPCGPTGPCRPPHHGGRAHGFYELDTLGSGAGGRAAVVRRPQQDLRPDG